MKPERNLWPAVLIGVLAILLTVNGYIFLNDHAINELHIGDNNTMSISSWFDSIFNNKPTPVQEVVKPAEEPVAGVQDSFIPPAPSVIEETIPFAETPAVTDSNITEEAVTPVESTLDAYAPLYAFAAHFGAFRGAIYFPQQPIEVVETTPAVSTETVTNDESVVPAVVATPAPSVLSTKGITSGYYVIGGVFCKERNAKKFLTQLNDSGYTDAELLMNESINCQRVSYKKFTSRKEAESFCREIKDSANPGAWVLAAK